MKDKYHIIKNQYYSGTSFKLSNTRLNFSLSDLDILNFYRNKNLQKGFVDSAEKKYNRVSNQTKNGYGIEQRSYGVSDKVELAKMVISYLNLKFQSTLK